MGTMIRGRGRPLQPEHYFAAGFGLPGASGDADYSEIRASALQFVRKLSGFTRPSRANQLAFDRAVDEVAKAARELLDSLVTNAPPRSRAVEASKARARAADRFRSDAQL